MNIKEVLLHFRILVQSLIYHNSLPPQHIIRAPYRHITHGIPLSGYEIQSPFIPISSIQKTQQPHTTKLLNRLTTIYESAPSIDDNDRIYRNRTANSEALQHFTFGLRSPLDHQVRSDHPKSLGEAIRLAIEYECKQSARINKYQNTNNQNAPHAQLNFTTAKQAQSKNEPTNGNKNSNTNVKEKEALSFTCNYCGSKGHLQPACEKRKKEKGFGNNCGSIGHTIEICRTKEYELNNGRNNNNPNTNNGRRNDNDNQNNYNNYGNQDNGDTCSIQSSSVEQTGCMVLNNKKLSHEPEFPQRHHAAGNLKPCREPTDTVSRSGLSDKKSSCHSYKLPPSTAQNNSTWVQRVAENKSENTATNSCKQPNTAVIRWARAGRSPPLISLQSEYIIRNKADIYIDTGAEISVVKRKYVNENISQIRKNTILAIRSVVSGKCTTLGTLNMDIGHGITCNLHIVPDSFPIDVAGLIGCDIIREYNREETFTIPARSRQIIFAKATNPEVKLGYVPIQNVGPNILFGNFLATNKNNMLYAYCYNTGHCPVKIPVPHVELIECLTPRHPSGHVIYEDHIDAYNYVSIRKLFFNTKEPIDVAVKNRILAENPDLGEERIDKIMFIIDTEGCTEEEIKHVRDLIKDFSGVFGLDGEPLPATNVLQHVIKLQTGKVVDAKRFRLPVEELRNNQIVEPLYSDFCSNLWIFSKKPDANGNQRWRLVVDFTQLNDDTEGTTWILPFTSDILELLASANVITVVDFKQGFHQIPIYPDSAPYTAFSTPVGTNGFQHLQLKECLWA
ncbi:hypothetical protein TSAR_006328 [Trichomalopsis sarcophagae]|uniref:CCHC-type domain-containing protein n=1 Tax=Trichomalopsis sarcophagae TaxID=543379 RepID=A0A232EJ90_9HYME|nr:hypothetical protein TSAR_006328 [Trichomalopsis sarcophagae]